MEIVLEKVDLVEVDLLGTGQAGVAAEAAIVAAVMDLIKTIMEIPVEAVAIYLVHNLGMPVMQQIVLP